MLTDRLGCDVTDLVPEKTLRELGLDSLDAVELLLAFEEEFDIVIDENELNERSSVADVSSYVEKLTTDRETWYDDY